MSKKSDLVRDSLLAMSIGTAMDDIRRKLGVTEEEFRILGTSAGLPHLERLIAGLKRPRLAEVSMAEVFLARLFENESIVLEETDGTQTISRATDVFTGFIDSAFANGGLDKPSAPTAKTELVIYQQIRNGTFKEIFDSVGYFWSPGLTPHQMIQFVQKHRRKLRSQWCGTFFPLQVGNKRFIAEVGDHLVGLLHVRYFPFSDEIAWSAWFQRRFVFPQMAPLAA